MPADVSSQALNVLDAYAFTSRTFPDSRGTFSVPFQQGMFLDTVGCCLPVAQINCSVSRRGAVRGVHFTDTSPGQAKYAFCTGGALLDVVVDVRVGSPTFGQWDAVRLEAGTGQAVYLAEGLGHACVALTDNTVLTYLCSAAGPMTTSRWCPSVTRPLRRWKARARGPVAAL